jgi:hypothetical protein
MDSAGFEDRTDRSLGGYVRGESEFFNSMLDHHIYLIHILICG